MRTEDEISDVLKKLVLDPDLREVPKLGDSFAYGYFAGKMHALRWVLGATDATAKMGINYRFDDWLLELKANQERDPDDDDNDTN